jgi:hypothetical protein
MSLAHLKNTGYQLSQMPTFRDVPAAVNGWAGLSTFAFSTLVTNRALDGPTSTSLALSAVEDPL